MYTVYIKKLQMSVFAEVETRILSKDNPAVFLKHMEVGVHKTWAFWVNENLYFPNKVPIGSMYGRFTYVTYIWLILW